MGAGQNLAGQLPKPAAPANPAGNVPNPAAPALAASPHFAPQAPPNVAGNQAALQNVLGGPQAPMVHDWNHPEAAGNQAALQNVLGQQHMPATGWNPAAGSQGPHPMGMHRAMGQHRPSFFSKFSGGGDPQRAALLSLMDRGQ
jgi:hypothetical protein